MCVRALTVKIKGISLLTGNLTFPSIEVPMPEIYETIVFFNQHYFPVSSFLERKGAHCYS